MGLIGAAKRKTLHQAFYPAVGLAKSICPTIKLQPISIINPDAVLAAIFSLVTIR
jgi:hypothetical protein